MYLKRNEQRGISASRCLIGRSLGFVPPSLLNITPESLILDWTQGLSSWYEAQYELQYDIVPLSPLNITLLITPESLILDSGHKDWALGIFPSFHQITKPYA